MTPHHCHHFFREKSLIVRRRNAMLSADKLNDKFNALFLIQIVVSGVQMRGDLCQ